MTAVIGLMNKTGIALAADSAVTVTGNSTIVTKRISYYKIKYKLMLEIITKEIIKEFLDNNSLELKSTHHRLSLPIINRIYKKMMNEIRFGDIKICGDLIIDGHHRYISSLIAEVKIGNSKCLKSSATVEYKWTAVDFTETEWDTEDKIQYLNELDAEFNNISMEEIIEITK